MSWLSEREIVHVYRKKDGTEAYIGLPASEEPPEVFEGGAYSGFLPDKVHLTFKTSFEVNGRIGYRYSTGDGKPRIVSATRERYEHNLGNKGTKALKQMGTDASKSVYTKSFQRLVDTKKRERR
jgi:hypothetical protein